MKQPIPVTILTGFLGSGKTSLLNRLLKERPGTKFGLVVNEFGEASLESQLVEARKQPLHELPSGCLCCVSDGDLKKALEAVMNKGKGIEHILVEASGLSSPGPLLGVLTDDGDFRLGGVFCLADATSFLDHEKQFPALLRQLNFADAVFLTKTDLAPPETILAVRARIDELKPGIRVLDTAGRLPWTILFETESESPTREESTLRVPPQRRFFQGGTHHETQILEYRQEAPLQPEALGAVFSSLDPGILRAKGILHLEGGSGNQYKYLVQYTGGQKQLYSRRWSSGETKMTSLLFLGSQFDASVLKQRLDACRAGTSF